MVARLTGVEAYARPLPAWFVLVQAQNKVKMLYYAYTCMHNEYIIGHIMPPNLC